MRKPLLCLACMAALFLTAFAPLVSAWSNGGYSSDPYNPDYGTHDYLFEHALNMLPSVERGAIVHNLSLALYGTEMPDNPNEIGDTTKHHVYYNSAGQLTDDSAAVRARGEYNLALGYLRSEDYDNAGKHIGAMSHYITDLAVFGHVMGAGTDWGTENHHSDYESYVQGRTTSYTSSYFDGYIVYDGSLTGMSAYNVATSLAYADTFGSGNVKPCTWMDANYSWSNPTFKDSCGASMNLAVNYLAEVLHQLYSDYGLTNNAPTLGSGSVSPTSGTTTTTFTYEVTYTDTDGDAPSYVKVYIDGTSYAMIKISGTYGGGTLYRYTTTLSAGSYTHYFSASDNRGATVRLPTSGSYSGPTVNRPPNLSSGSVSPSSGTPSTTFTYEVTYTDADGDAPSYVRVYIDGSAETMTKISGTYTGGALCRCETTLSAGSHTYYFEASDGVATARLPSSGDYSGPVVTSGTILFTSLTVSPSSFTIKSENSTQLTATLRDNSGNLLAYKTVTWSKSRTDGTLWPTSGISNSSGQVMTTYTAPTVSAQTSVTITASFAGSATYLGSGGASSGTITPPTKPATTLTISPSSFSVSSGGTQTLIATLTTNGAPLANKIITWAKTAGSLSTPSGTTNSSGQVSVTYTAPTVDNQTSVTITASFASDNSYSGSQGSSTGTISPPPPIFIAVIAAIVLVAVLIAVIWRYLSRGARKLRVEG